MKWHDANQVVEELRRDTRLYLPALSERRGFSSSRVEHLLNRLVQKMPADECYLEVGTLEGRTLEAASKANDGKTLIGCDPCTKYDMRPEGFSGSNVKFVSYSWQELLRNFNFKHLIGCVFYDGDHSAAETTSFMACIEEHLANEAVLVLDDWDRETVREGAYRASHCWRLLREMPCYGDGLTAPRQHFGYSFGVAVWGFER
jgi:hypothetical protein